MPGSAPLSIGRLGAHDFRRRWWVGAGTSNLSKPPDIVERPGFKPLATRARDLCRAALRAVQHGSYAHGLPRESRELHFIGVAIAMNVHTRANVTSLQALSGNIARQHHAIVLFDH